MSSPTQRTLQWLRALGAECQVVERFCTHSKRRIDLFGFIDIVALLGPNCIGVQATSGANHAHRVEKIKAEPKALAWLKAGNLIEVHSWQKAGPTGKRKLWQCRREEIVEADFAQRKQVLGELL